MPRHCLATEWLIIITLNFIFFILNNITRQTNAPTLLLYSHILYITRIFLRRLRIWLISLFCQCTIFACLCLLCGLRFVLATPCLCDMCFSSFLAWSCLIDARVYTVIALVVEIIIIISCVTLVLHGTEWKQSKANHKSYQKAQGERKTKKYETR